MRGKRRSPAEIARHRRLISNLYLQGLLQAEIAEQVGVGQATVSRDLKALREEWLRDSKKDIEIAKAQEMAKIDRLERVYHEAWTRSCEEKVTTATEKTVGVGVSASGKRDKASVRREKLIGDKRFLDGVQWCIEQRCKILGVEAPSRSEIMVRELDITVHRDRE